MQFPIARATVSPSRCDHGGESSPIDIARKHRTVFSRANTRTMLIGSRTSTEASSRLTVSTDIPGELSMPSTRFAGMIVGNSALALRFTLERAIEGDGVDADVSPEAILVCNSTIHCSGLRDLVD